MQLKKIFRQYQGLTLSIVTLLACGIGFVVGIVPLAQKIIEVNTQYGVLSKNLDVLKSKTALLEALNEEELRNKVKTLLSAVPSDRSLPTVLGTLDGLAASSGVSLGSVSLTRLGSLSTASAERLTADEQGVGTNILPLSINLAGTLDQIHAFLAEAISVRRLLRVRTFDISLVKAATGSSNIVSVALAMDAFYSPLPTAIGAVSQPLTDITNEESDLIAKVEAMKLLVVPVSALPPPSSGAGKSDPFSL